MPVTALRYLLPSVRGLEGLWHVIGGCRYARTGGGENSDLMYKCTEAPLILLGK